LFCRRRERCANTKVVRPMLKSVLCLFHITACHTNDGFVTKDFPCVRNMNVILP
jgi:hypothetical protein